MQKVTKESNLGEVVGRYPKTAEIMLEYGLHCAGCFANAFDTIEQGAAIHALSEEEIQEMLFRINEIVKRYSIVDSGKENNTLSNKQ